MELLKRCCFTMKDDNQTNISPTKPIHALMFDVTECREGPCIKNHIDFETVTTGGETRHYIKKPSTSAKAIGLRDRDEILEIQKQILTSHTREDVTSILHHSVCDETQSITITIRRVVENGNYTCLTLMCCRILEQTDDIIRKEEAIELTSAIIISSTFGRTNEVIEDVRKFDTQTNVIKHVKCDKYLTTGSGKGVSLLPLQDQDKSYSFKISTYIGIDSLDGADTQVCFILTPDGRPVYYMSGPLHLGFKRAGVLNLNAKYNKKALTTMQGDGEMIPQPWFFRRWAIGNSTTCFESLYKPGYFLTVTKSRGLTKVLKTKPGRDILCFRYIRKFSFEVLQNNIDLHFQLF